MSKYSWLLLLVIGAPVQAQNVDLDNYQSLVSDVKSYAVGEPVIVVVVESTSAEATAGTGVERNTAVSAGVNSDRKIDAVGMNVDSNSDGEGKTSRRGRVTTQLSATIIEVLPNSMLKIKGIQDLTINGEKQRVVVSGVIRASDISKNNSIFSYQIANVELEVAGKGSISEAQKQNVIFKFFNWLGLL